MKVLIRNEQGQYLSRHRGQIAFVERREQAYVYDTEEDHVDDQLAIVKERYGWTWTAEPLDQPAMPVIGETTKRMFGIESGSSAQVAGGRSDADQEGDHGHDNQDGECVPGSV